MADRDPDPNQDVMHTRGSIALKVMMKYVRCHTLFFST